MNAYSAHTTADLLIMADLMVDVLSARTGEADRAGTWILPLIQARRLHEALQRVQDFEALKAARAHVESSAGVPVTTRSASRSGFDGTSFHPVPGQAQRIN